MRHIGAYSVGVGSGIVFKEFGSMRVIYLLFVLSLHKTSVFFRVRSSRRMFDWSCNPVVDRRVRCALGVALVDVDFTSHSPPPWQIQWVILFWQRLFDQQYLNY